MALRMSGLVSGMDTESIVSELMKAQRAKSTKIENNITTTEWKQEKWKDLNSKIYSFYTNNLAKMKMQGSFNTKTVTSSNESKASVTAATNAPEGTHLLKVKQLASAQFATGAKLGTDLNSKAITVDTKLADLGMTAGESNTITVATGTKSVSLTIAADTTIDDFTKTLKDAGLNATYDATQKRYFISSKQSGYENAFSISTSGSVDLSKLGLNTITKSAPQPDGTVTVTGGGAMKLVAPTDAKFIYNGAEITSSSNNVTANGLTFTLKGVTSGLDTLDESDDEVISLGVSDNTKAVYDMVKEFVKKYNELITDMNKAYNATSAKGYDPLTDDEKSSMTDDQITTWETKIKDSLLRKDETLNTVLSSMRSNLSRNVTVSGKSYSLASFGIASANYTEKGQLHINGDQDDSLVSGKDNDLMKALTEDPDKVMTVFNELAGNLYTSLTDNMKSTTLRSALTLYNDKDMTKQITNYKADLKTFESKLQDMEDRYYKQFSAMETAMAKMNSESSNLASMLGSGN